MRKQFYTTEQTKKNLRINLLTNYVSDMLCMYLVILLSDPRPFKFIERLKFV